jgi:DNA polymerase-1
MPDDLSRQIEPLHELVRALGWPLLMIDGVEADDVIGTLTTRAVQSGMKAVVSTGDKDLAQLVNEHVSLVNTMSNETLDPAGVLAKFGVPPERIVDYFALVGDSVDNVPGVDKVGPKTAVKWLTQFGSLDGIVEHAADIGGVVGQNLRQFAFDFLPLAQAPGERALRSRTAARAALSWRRRPMQIAKRLIELFAHYEMRSWLREVQGEGSSRCRGAGSGRSGRQRGQRRPSPPSFLPPGPHRAGYDDGS